MHTIEIVSFGSRVAGRLTGKIALGTTLSLTIHTISRFILILFLPSLGYLVESGINLNTYLILVVTALILGFIASVIIIYKLNTVQVFFQAVFSKYEKNTVPIAIIKSLFNRKNESIRLACDKFTFNKVIFKKTFVSVLAYIFLISGFFISFLLAVLYPENRLTLSQFTAVFHGFGAVIFAFYLDPMLSRSIDSNSDDVTWLKNVYSILFGRMLSYFVITVLLLIFLLFRISWF